MARMLDIFVSVLDVLYLFVLGGGLLLMLWELVAQPHSLKEIICQFVFKNVFLKTDWLSISQFD